MNRIEIRALIEEENECCVSIIIPTHRTAPDRRVDQEVLAQSTEQAKQVLLKNQELPQSTIDRIMHSIDKMVLEFDPLHSLEGLGIFVSTEVAKLVYFPFPVSEKIRVDKVFEVRDLYYLEQYSKPYYVLKLTKDQAHLYQLETGSPAREIANTYFPMRNSYEYEYARPSIGTSYGFASKGFEKDKSIMLKTRQEPFYKEVANHVLPYAKVGDLLISGSKSILSIFDSGRDKKLRIRGRVNGSFNDNNDLFNHARLTYYECRHSEIQSLIDSLEELIGMKRVAFGIRDVWLAAHAGKGDTLIVEKDYKETGIALHDGQHLNLGFAAGPNLIEAADRVDEVINIIHEKGGKVVFTEKNQLEKYNQIALILRY